MDQSEQKTIRRQRLVKVILSHPNKDYQRTFTNPKPADVLKWIEEMKRLLPEFEGEMSFRRRFIRNKPQSSKGHLYGFAVYIINEQ